MMYWWGLLWDAVVIGNCDKETEREQHIVFLWEDIVFN